MSQQRHYFNPSATLTQVESNALSQQQPSQVLCFLKDQEQRQAINKETPLCQLALTQRPVNTTVSTTPISTPMPRLIAPLIIPKSQCTAYNQLLYRLHTNTSKGVVTENIHCTEITSLSTQIQPPESITPTQQQINDNHSTQISHDVPEVSSLNAERKRNQADMNGDDTMLCKWQFCSATFSTLDDLTPHLFKIHLNSRTIDFQCHWEACTVSTEESEELFNHLTNHLGTKLHGCRWTDCRERFDTFNQLTGHLTELHVGAGQSEYKCQWKECDREGKVFSQRQKVIRHIQTHTGDKPYQCHLCTKKFSEANSMTHHMRTHTGEKPYKCLEKDCQRAFSISSALTIHRRIHSGEKPFSCKHKDCERRFSESSNLTKHMRVHTGERPFRCTFMPCGKSFSRPDQVSRHLKIHEKREKSGHSIPIEHSRSSLNTNLTN